MAPTKFDEMFPHTSLMTFDERHPKSVVANAAGPVNGVGYPLPEDDEVVLSRWTLPESIFSLEYDAGEAFADPVEGEARTLVRGEVAALLTNRNLRGVFVSGHSEVLGYFRAGWTPGTKVRSIYFAWPLDRIDAFDVSPSEGRVKGMYIDTVAPRARLVINKAHVAQDHFGVKGIGVVNRLTEFYRQLLHATTNAHRQSADVTCRALAANVAAGGQRTSNHGGAVVWYRQPTELR